MKLIIQIPCYNEEKTLPLTFKELPKSIKGIDVIEYLIINDGSSDNTVQVAKELGIHHIVNFKNNKGLAKGFLAGIDACLKLGADIIVNTDADNQYCGEDIVKLVEPIVSGTADMVIGERPISQTAHFSPLKKKLQKLGSFVVRIASGTKVPDTTSGFRAYSKSAAMRINVINAYTYTLETIIQAGQNKTAISTAKIQTNPETRESRLFKSMYRYISKSALVIVRSFIMYKPLKFFCAVGMILISLGIITGIRFLIFFFGGNGSGHMQSLILASLLIMLGAEAIITGLLSDVVAANRRLLEDIQYRVKNLEIETVYKEKQENDKVL
ncbi:MAG: glycosyltransferase family 2 protein [Syntrophomonadaceae bacterium]|jgi:glycosyltransferase involved in cell wall biosynthesis|nr:glycosyltransferase family 2 protein [Syntrophomonadaceae bacterium]